MAIKAVGFDIDGTLYPNRRLYARLLPFLLTNLPLLISMGKARTELRATPGLVQGATGTAFYATQAKVAARHLGKSAEEVMDLFERKIYRGWGGYFSKIRPWDGSRDAILRLKAAGLKIGALSDFPARDKLERLGFGGLWDAILCSEEVGRLKPAPEPFRALAAELGAAPGEILYVGNSEAYDVAGAAAAGMRTALAARGRKPVSKADLVFSDYSELADWTLARI